MQARCLPSAPRICLVLYALVPSHLVFFHRLAQCPLPILGFVVRFRGHSPIGNHRHTAPKMRGPGGFEGSVRGLDHRRLAELGGDWSSIGVHRRESSYFPSLCLRQSVGGQRCAKGYLHKDVGGEITSRRDRVKSRLLPLTAKQGANGPPGLPHCSSRDINPACPAIESMTASLQGHQTTKDGKTGQSGPLRLRLNIRSATWEYPLQLSVPSSHAVLALFQDGRAVCPAPCFCFPCCSLTEVFHPARPLPSHPPKHRS